MTGKSTVRIRNYQLYFLKLLFAIAVVVRHSSMFADNSIKALIPSSLGWVSVHFFFIVSGLFMINSYMKKKDSYNKTEAGHSAITFVLDKFRKMSLEYWVALFITIVVIIVLGGGHNVRSVITNIFPELFAISNSSIITVEFNSPTWYISTMLISMLFLYYLLIKNNDFFMYIFTPIVALMLMGYLYQQDGFANRLEFNGLLYLGVIRAICGICFGAIAWMIADKIKLIINSRKRKILITILEIMIYILFFTTWLRPNQDKATIYSILYILPLGIAITFSGKSYVSMVFKNQKMKYFEPLAMAIFLNHWAAIKLVNYFALHYSYLRKMVIFMIFIIMLTILYFLLIKLINKIKRSYFCSE